LTLASRIVIDSWAWLELFGGSEKGRKVEQEITKAAESFTSSVTLAEVVSVSARRGRPTDDKVAAIRSLSRVVAPSSDDAVEAGILHARTKKDSRNFSLADAFVLQAAGKMNARVLTGDPDFKVLKGAQLLE
jgi:PIN domain nuclease of toxin-antitoxin system